jgi:hypothetical protein
VPTSAHWMSSSPRLCSRAAVTDTQPIVSSNLLKEPTMADPLKKGEKYRCPKDECGCEIEVTKGADNCPAENPQPPRCCCGCEMVKV